MDTDRCHSLDAAIALVAARQHGNVTRPQLLVAGADDNAIRHRVRSGRLHRVYLGVYAVGRPPATPLERASAAVLACGPDAALSHSSAMVLWGFWKRWSTSFEVISPHHRRSKAITAHRSRTLTRGDVTTQLGIPVTTPARTLFDCEPRLEDKQLARAVNDALLSRFLTRGQLKEFLRRHPNRRLQPFVETTDGPTRSPFEDDFLAFCAHYGLPRPKINTIVAGREADAYFETARLIVELDGWESHSNRHSFEDERERDANALEHGIGTLRVTKGRIRNAPEREADRLQEILQQRRP